jgi:hypothetical protein
VTLPEGKKQSPEHSQLLDETRAQSHPALEEHPQNSEASPHPADQGPKDVTEEEVGEQQDATRALQQTPSRRGIWNWARAGTGRLNIIGRIPHPEWRGPVTVGNPGAAANGVMNGGAPYQVHDDFSIPSTTATEPDDVDRQREAAAAKLEVLGTGNVQTMSPSFAQTKRSSDDLISAASSTGSPEWKRSDDEQWTNGEASTPSAAQRDSPPTTPDTPTPQQRVKGLSLDARKALSDQPSPTPQRDTDRPLETQGPSTKDDPKEESGADAENATPTKDKPMSEATPKSNAPAKPSKLPKQTSTPRSIPKYKIALAPNLLSPARAYTAST